MFQPSAPYLAHVKAFRQAVSLPVLHAGGIRDVASARHVLRDGIADLAGMTRAFVADPHLVNKISGAGRPHPPLCRCLLLPISLSPLRPSPRHDARNYPQPRSPCPAFRRAVVVGGGPAGTVAARVSAERGLRVTLIEAAPRLGGQILVAAQAPRRRDLLGITEWRQAELDRLGVDDRLRSWMLIGCA